MLHLVACNCLATNLIAMHTSFVVADEAHMGVNMGGVSRVVYNFAKKKKTVPNIMNSINIHIVV